MNCERVQDLLNEYIDGELPAAAREGVEQHVAGCARCRAELRALRQAAELVRSLPRAAAPEGMAAAIKSRVARAAGIRRRAALARWVGVGGWVAAAATLLVVIKLASWAPEPAAPGGGAEGRRGSVKAVSAVPDEKHAAEDKVHLEKTPEAAADARRKLEGVAPPRIRPDEKDDALSIPEVCATAAPNVLARDVVDGADATPPAPGQMLAAEPDTDHRARAMKQAEPVSGAAKGAEEQAAAQPAAPAAALRDRAEAGEGRDGRKDVLKREESIHELAYSCKDAASGLAEVRRLVLAAGGTLADAEGKDKEAEAAQGAILASVPADRLGWLAAQLKQAEGPGRAEAKGLVSANGTAGAPVEPKAFGVGDAGRGGAGKPAAVTVRIVLKVKPKSGE